MNKYQEALDNIKKAPGFMGGNSKYKSNIQSSIPFLEDIAILQELVDKKDPMKPIWKGTDVHNATFYYSYCPKCKTQVSKHTNKYCSKCGQKIDWSELQ